MLYKIEVSIVKPPTSEGRYGSNEKIYEQTVEGLNIYDVIMAVNKAREDDPISSSHAEAAS